MSICIFPLTVKKVLTSAVKGCNRFYLAGGKSDPKDSKFKLVNGGTWHSIWQYARKYKKVTVSILVVSDEVYLKYKI